MTTDTLTTPTPTFKRMPVVPPPPAIYPNVSEAEYHRWAAWSKSSLWYAGEWDQMVNACMPAPGRTPSKLKAYLDGRITKTSKDLEFGKLYHAMLLEPWRVDAEFHHITTPINMRSKKGKATMAALQQQFGADRVITDEDWQTCEAMVGAMAENLLAREYIGAIGKYELSGTWIDPETQLPCRLRIDKLIEHDQDFIVDVKTARCAHWRYFEPDIAKYGYDAQLAMYRDGYKILTGRDARAILIAQEKTGDYEAIVYELRPEELAAGRVKYKAALRVVAACIKSGKWPGSITQTPGTAPLPVTLPKWGMAEDEGDAIDTDTENEGADRE